MRFRNKVLISSTNLHLKRYGQQLPSVSVHVDDHIIRKGKRDVLVPQVVVGFLSCLPNLYHLKEFPRTRFWFDVWLVTCIRSTIGITMKNTSEIYWKKHNDIHYTHMVILFVINLALFIDVQLLFWFWMEHFVLIKVMSLWYLFPFPCESSLSWGSHYS